MTVRDVLARVLGPGILAESSSYALCSGFGCTTYTLTLESVEYAGGQVTVNLRLTRSADTAINDQLITVEVGGVQIAESEESFFSGDGRPHTVTGPGSPGDTVIVTMDSMGVFGDRTTSVSGIVPSEPGNGGGNGNGGDGDGADGGGRAVRVVGGAAVGAAVSGVITAVRNRR